MKVASSPEATNPLKYGEIVPNGELISSLNEKYTLHNLIEGRLAVIVFYRGGW